MSDQIENIKLTEIFADESFNSRGRIAPIDVADLAKSIEKDGLIQPVVVTDLVDDPEGRKYKLIAGFRRHMAHRILERDTIPAIYRAGIGDRQARILNLKENIDRENLNIYQEALAIKQLNVLGGTQEQIAKETGQSKGWVQVRLMLLELPEEIQREAAAGFLTQQQIRDINMLPTADEQYAAVKRIKKYKMGGGKGSIKVRKSDKTKVKKRRERADIFEAMDMIQEAVGAGFHSRCMAWCAGEITDYDFHASIQEYANEKGVPYAIPQEIMPKV